MGDMTARGRMSKQAVIRIGPDGSTLRARMLGARLRERRETAGMTLAEVGKQIRRSHASLSRWESGDQVPRPGDLHYMLARVYGVDEIECDELLQLADEARDPPESDAVATKVADYGWMERRAGRLEVFQDVVVPGLLQTEGYIRAVLKAWDPTDFVRGEIELLVRARLERQQRLTDASPIEICAVLSEAVLWSQVGGPEVWREQLRHLLSRAALPNVELRVIPLTVGAERGLVGSFTILRFAGPSDPDLAWVTTRGGDVYFEDPTPFAQAFKRSRRVALSHRESVDMIAAISKESR